MIYDWKRFVGMILSSLGNVVGTYFVALSFQLSIDAGVNQGVISSLFVLSAVFCAVCVFCRLLVTLLQLEFCPLNPNQNQQKRNEIALFK